LVVFLGLFQLQLKQKDTKTSSQCSPGGSKFRTPLSGKQKGGEEEQQQREQNRTEAEVLDVAFLRAINTKKNKNKIMKVQGNKQQRQERAIRHKRAPMTINHREIFPATARKKN
jgi:hypothetical protein